ncbi:MAG: LysR family transcriptional regulator [Clostridiales bacterium]|nr:LysR family transcriptional regulator [Clostridiales bacterium]
MKKAGEDMDFQKLEYFKTIAEYENLSKASRKLLVAQSMLSRTVKELEQELEVKLFDRVGRSIRLNENGYLFLGYVNEILDLGSQAKAELKARAAADQKVIRITRVQFTRMFPELFVGFRRSEPEARIVFLKRNPSSEEEWDFIIHSSDDMATAKDSVVMYEEKCLVAVAKNHPLASEDAVSMEQLRQEDFVVMEDMTPMGQMVQKICADHGFSPRIVMECDSQNTVSSMVSRNLGVTILPAITWEGNRDDLVLKEFREEPIRRRVYMTAQDGILKMQTPRKFWEYSHDYFSQAALLRA